MLILSAAAADAWLSKYAGRFMYGWSAESLKFEAETPLTDRARQANNEIRAEPAPAFLQSLKRPKETNMETETIEQQGNKRWFGTPLFP